jgi:hypothetical protein
LAVAGTTRRNSVLIPQPCSPQSSRSKSGNCACFVKLGCSGRLVAPYNDPPRSNSARPPQREHLSEHGSMSGAIWPRWRQSGQVIAMCIAFDNARLSTGQIASYRLCRPSDIVRYRRSCPHPPAWGAYHPRTKRRDTPRRAFFPFRPHLTRISRLEVWQ